MRACFDPLIRGQQSAVALIHRIDVVVMGNDHMRFELVDDRIARVDGNKVITEGGAEREADVLVLATGFDVLRILSTYDAVGRSGKTLRETWDDDNAQAYLGTVVPDFPNFFMLLGPNSGLGHNSVILMIEAQVAHICRVLSAMRDQNLPAITPSAEAQAAFEAEIDARLSDSVWQAGGCVSWYQDENGRNTTLWPGTVREYQRRMAKSGLEQYIPVVADEPAGEFP